MTTEQPQQPQQSEPSQQPGQPQPAQPVQPASSAEVPVSPTVPASPAAPVAPVVAVAAAAPAAPSKFGPMVNAILTDSLDAVKKFFSPRPLEAAGGALAYTSLVCAFLGGVYVLAVFLLHLAMATQVGGYGAHLGYGALLAVASFGVLVGGVKLIFIIRKIDVPFIRVMNFVSVAILPATAAVLLGAIVTFINYTWGQFVVSAGVLGGAACLYSAVRKATESADAKSDPFWLVLGLLAVFLLVITLFNYAIADSQWSGLRNSMEKAAISKSGGGKSSDGKSGEAPTPAEIGKTLFKLLPKGK